MSAEMMVAVVAVVAAMAFALGYAIGGSETQEDAAPSETKEEVSANVRLILEAERARKEAAEANLHLEIALARNAELVEQDEVEAVGVFLLLKGGGMAKGYLHLTVDHMREVAKELQDDIVQGLTEMALQEMMDEEGEEF